jgi:hypothetical protein
MTWNILSWVAAQACEIVLTIIAAVWVFVVEPAIYFSKEIWKAIEKFL